MPVITRWFIKAALVYFVAALMTGMALAAPPLWTGLSFLRGLNPVYFHLFLVGWVTQLIIGMVLWMFPKYSREQPRNKEWVSWLVFGLLNAGLLLRAVSEPLAAQRPGSSWGWALAVSALVQWLAGMLFVGNVWGRVKEK